MHPQWGADAVLTVYHETALDHMDNFPVVRNGNRLRGLESAVDIVLIDHPSRYTHVIFHLNNDHQLRFADVRQFGRLWLVPTDSLGSLAGLKNLGVEPLGELFTREFLKKELRRRHAKIKPLLLDQTFIAGLGNIYTDEVLHRARINPERLATTLTPREIARLYHSIRDVLSEGIENRGTTVRDFADGDGRPGGYQEMLRVYSREGEPCPQCGKTIVRKKVGGRSSYFCPSCQKH